MAHERLKAGEHGEIFIKQASSGSFQARVRVRLLDGTETQISRSRKTRAAARLAVQAEIEDRLKRPKGSADLKHDSTVGLAARQWIDELRVQSAWPNARRRPQTVDEYERLLGTLMVPKLGRLRLHELTTSRCQAWIDGIIEAGRKGQHDMVVTAAQVRMAFKAVLDRAIVHDALRSNPMDKTTTPRRKQPNPAALTVTDVFRLRAAVRAWEADRAGRPGPPPNGHVPVAVDVMLGTGLRIGEVLALNWAGVNLTTEGLPTVTVDATMVDIRGRGTVRQGMPKTDAGERTIIIPAFTAESLRGLRPEAALPQAPVFPSRRKAGRDEEDVRPQTPHNVRRTLRAALEHAGMKGEVHPHLLRSTVATFVARERGTAAAAALLGHKIQGGVTQRHYVERLRVAPDVSSILQTMVEIGEEEAAAKTGWTTRRTLVQEPAASRARATLATRPEKSVHALSDLSESWRARGGAVLRADPADWARTVLTPGNPRAFGPTGRSDGDVVQVARQVVEVVGEKRSTWRHWNLWAEASRQTMGWRFATVESREGAIARVVAEATRQSVRLTPGDLAPTPAILERDDGSCVFRPRHSAYFTSEHHLRAEARLLDGVKALDGPTVPAAAVEEAATAASNGLPPSAEQTSAIRSVATSGREVDVLVGPAGAGKTTTMRALLLAWTAEHGGDSVIGLAPSAVAAGVLGADLGITCDTTSKWLYEQSHGRAAFRRGQLVIVDEATLAPTSNLDLIASAVRQAGAKLLLVGDWAQLQSVDAGGAFSLLVEARGAEVAELTDVHRFVNAWERDASLALRRGDVEAIDAYGGHGRLRQGATEQMVDTAYEAWRTDLASGKVSILVTDSAESVRMLNQRARAERILDGETDAGRDAAVADDLRVSAGDLVISRLNDRHLRTDHRDWVRNGDRWRVEHVGRDGSLEVRRPSQHGSVITLPAWYVAEHVDLGYAVTAHRAQGLTVDTSHVVVTGSTTRENFYVAMTRGQHSNVAYIALDKPDESHAPPRPGDATAASVLCGVLHHSGRELSAHEIMRAEQERWGGIAQIADEYDAIATSTVRERWTELVCRIAATQGHLTTLEVDDMVNGRSFGALLSELRRADAYGYDAAELLHRVIAGQSLVGADDVGAVLSARVARAARAVRGADEPVLIAGLVPEVRGEVPADTRAALDARRDLIAGRAAALADGAVRTRAAWVRRIGDAPRRAAEREMWMRRIATVAVYRDRYGITSREPLGAEGADLAQRRDAGLARAALREACSLSASTTVAPVSAGTRGLAL